MPCTINKKGPYFVTVHGGSPGTLTFSEKNYLPADTYRFRKKHPVYKGRCQILLSNLLSAENFVRKGGEGVPPNP